MTKPITVAGDVDGRYLEVTINRVGWKPQRFEIVASPGGRKWQIALIEDTSIEIDLPNGARARAHYSERYGGGVSLYDATGRYVGRGWVMPDGLKPDDET